VYMETKDVYMNNTARPFNGKHGKNIAVL